MSSSMPTPVVTFHGVPVSTRRKDRCPGTLPPGLIVRPALPADHAQVKSAPCVSGPGDAGLLCS